jgi:hypothetical protein
MLSFLHVASSTFFKYAQNEGFAFKKFKMFMVGVGMPPSPPSMFEPLHGPHRWYLGPYIYTWATRFLNLGLGAQMANAY